MDDELGVDEGDAVGESMKMSDAWAAKRSDANVVTQVASLRVMAHFGSDAPPASKVRKKPESQNEFVVGETEVGGTEVVR
jgi:hypothetical protein